MSKKFLFSVTKKDLIIDYYSGHGPGGQKRNKCKNCVRIRHPESGALVTAQEERSKEQNLRNAMRRLVENIKFKVWINRKAWEVENKMTVEELVEQQMRPEDLRTEVLVDDKWVVWNE